MSVARAPARPDTGARRVDPRRLVARHRRPLAAVLAGLAALAALSAVRPAPPATGPVVVAADDLPAGIALRPDDLSVTQVPLSLVPPGAAGDPADLLERVLAAPIARGEALTDTRLVSTARLGPPGAGLVAAPVRIGDPGAVALLAPGTVVDVLAARGDDSPARVVAHGARVLTVPRSRPTASGGLLDGSESAGGDGSLVVLAVSSATALELAHGAAAGRLSVVLRG